MNKISVLSLFFTIGLISCKPSDAKIDNLEIARQYYEVLDHSDDSKIAGLLSDSIVIRESDYDYQEVFSLSGYIQWLEWDAVFNPTYEVLQIEKSNKMVKVRISKIDDRISFLHQQPIVTDELIRFDNGKIIQVERTNVVFDEDTFVKNREALLTWIDQNHPELNGFINDQTRTGGLNYLKAIEQYQNRK